PVLHEILLPGDEHWHTRPVLASIKHLLGHVRAHVHRKFRCTEERYLATEHIEPPDRGGRQEICVGKEGLGIMHATVETVGPPQPWQLDLVERLALKIADAHDGMRVLQIFRDDSSAEYARAAQSGLRLRQDVAPVLTRRPSEINGDQTCIRRTGR